MVTLWGHYSSELFWRKQYGRAKSKPEIPFTENQASYYRLCRRPERDWKLKENFTRLSMRGKRNTSNRMLELERKRYRSGR